MRTLHKNVEMGTREDQKAVMTLDQTRTGQRYGLLSSHLPSFEVTGSI